MFVPLQLSPDPRCFAQRGNQSLMKRTENAGIKTYCQNSTSSHQIILEQTHFRYVLGGFFFFKQTIYSDKRIKGAKENLPEKTAHS